MTAAKIRTKPAAEIRASIIARAEELERDAYALRLLARTIQGRSVDATKTKILLYEAKGRI